MRLLKFFRQDFVNTYVGTPCVHGNGNGFEFNYVIFIKNYKIKGKEGKQKEKKFSNVPLKSLINQYVEVVELPTIIISYIH